MSDTKGHFTIGDLSFSFDGDLKELAHCQEIIREIRNAEYDLRSYSGADDVYLVYDDDLEGERGTFDKMRLRAYGNGKSYTIDLGVTDTNPLGIYVGYDTPIDVYDYDRESRSQIPRGEDDDSGAQDGDRDDEGRTTGGDPQSSHGGAERDSRGSKPDEEDTPDGDLITTEDDDRLVSDVKEALNSGRGDEKIGAMNEKVMWQTMQRSGLSKQSYGSLCNNFGIEDLRELPFNQVVPAYNYIHDLIQFVEDDLPI